MKHAFDPFADAIQPVVEGLRVLQKLVGAFGCPDMISSLGIDICLPVRTDEAFVAEDMEPRR